jgi:hypothetical protein
MLLFAGVRRERELDDLVDRILRQVSWDSESLANSIQDRVLDGETLQSLTCQNREPKP